MRALLLALILIATNSKSFASELTSCEYENKNDLIVVTGSEIFTTLMIDTSWVYVGDCPRMVGLHYATNTGSATEFHTLYRSETNDLKKTKQCFYHLEVNDEKKFENVTCKMAL